MNKILIAIASCLLFVMLTAFTMPNFLPESSWIDGNWKGEKYQVNMGKAWLTELNVDTESDKFTIRYPELQCDGYLELVKLTETEAIFIEKIMYGTCLSDGYIIITRVTDKLISFSCLRDNKTRLASYCTLEKQ